MDPIPIIRLEISQMKRTLSTALTRYTLELDDTLQAAIEAYCTPENLQRVIGKQVNETLDMVIQEEVNRWFVHGDGRKIVKDAVIKRIEENEQLQ